MIFIVFRFLKYVAFDPGTTAPSVSVIHFSENLGYRWQGFSNIRTWNLKMYFNVLGLNRYLR